MGRWEFRSAACNGKCRTSADRKSATFPDQSELDTIARESSPILIAGKDIGRHVL